MSEMMITENNDGLMPRRIDSEATPGEEPMIESSSPELKESAHSTIEKLQPPI